MDRSAISLTLAAIVLGVVAFAGACGGGGGDANGSDEDYVVAICSTVAELETEVQALGTAIEDAGTVDELNEVLGKFAEAFEAAADRLDEAAPPADVREAHKRVVDAFQDAADAMESGDAASLEGFDPGSLELPASARERLAAAAANAPQCQGLGIFDR